ncbi:MAG TPA: hypothetical protein VIU12_02085 [Chryseolinea sp.]
MISIPTKHLTRLMLCVFLIFTFQSCIVATQTKQTPSGKVPPGQAKKATGSQSAKPYAPGQQKKKSKTK